jgi:hypothetical protein
LEALENILEWPDCQMIPEEKQSDILKRAIAAIRKAHGESEGK